MFPTEFHLTDDIVIKINDRISIFGRTGTGKTFFVKHWLLYHYEKYVFWDVKHENRDVRHDILVNTPKELKEVIGKYDKILYQPSVATEKDFDEVCEIVFNNRNRLIYVDEASIISSATKIEDWHNMIMTQGRTYGVGIINASQRPRIIHNTLISESEHLFIFHLNLETDIYKIRQQTGDAADEIKYLPEHYFMYYSVRFNKSYLFKPVKIPEMDENGNIKEIPKLERYQPTLNNYIKITAQQ